MPHWLHMLTIIFVIAKLAGYIHWSWWLVLLPSIIGLLIGLLLLVGVVGLALFVDDQKWR